MTGTSRFLLLFPNVVDRHIEIGEMRSGRFEIFWQTCRKIRNVLNVENRLIDGDILGAAAGSYARRSKTDQEGEGRKVGIPYGSTLATCPVRALRVWLEAAGINSGALFPSSTRHGRIQTRMSGYAVALIVKRHAGSAGLDTAIYSGHSLRAGFATSAAIGGASERSIMNQTGHRSSAMVRRYIRDASLFRENAAAKVGL